MKKIKEMIRQYGILVIRAIWPESKKHSLRKLGLIVVTPALLLGVTQASSIGEMILGKAAGATQVQAEPIQQFAATSPAAAVDQTTTTTDEISADAPTIVDLIADSEIILRGAVKEVTDGFENGVPYTQVTLSVDETLRGQVGDEYTFRQFGLTQPRKMDNGKIYIGTTPEGWSKYSVGEDAMLFLYKSASMTGLRTTTGLGQGKVVFQGGNAVSQMGNEGLFDNVEVNANLLNDKDKRLLATKKGAVNAEGFKSFVKRAIAGRWIEGGKMRHAKK